MTRGSATEPEQLPASLQPLAEALACLSDADRDRVIRVARGRRRLNTVPWEDLWAAQGIAPVGGGNAVADCDAIYDDT